MKKLLKFKGITITYWRFSLWGVMKTRGAWSVALGRLQIDNLDAVERKNNR